MVHGMLFFLVDVLFFYVSLCLGMYSVAIMAVFCSSFRSFPDMLFIYFLNASELAPVTLF